MKTFLILSIVLLTNVGHCQTDSCDFIYGRQSSLLIFSGEVKKIRCINSMGLRYEVVFNVDSVYKGTVTKTFNIYTSANKEVCYSDRPCYLCGFSFEKGKRYIVYVCGEEHGFYITNRCTFTKKINQNEIVELRDDLTK